MNDTTNRGTGQTLPKEEYIEQAYLFRGLSKRMESAEPIQEMLKHIREEILATTKLPHAIDFLLAELNHVGTMSSAMRKMQHYFTPFQTYLIEEAENERGRFDMDLALRILEQEANMRGEGVDIIPLFFFQFEAVCRNRLNYDHALTAISSDPAYNQSWRNWILEVRHKIGLVEIADLVYVYSEHYQTRNQHHQPENDHEVLFGEKEGRVALANRNKETLYFFSALQRQLKYPAAPRPVRKDPNADLLPKLARMVERMDLRIKLLEDEQRDKGIDLSQFYDDSSPS